MAEDLKAGTMPTDVVIHPFGEIEEALLEAVRQAIEQRFRVRATTGEPRNLPDNSYSSGVHEPLRKLARRVASGWLQSIFRLQERLR